MSKKLADLKAAATAAREAANAAPDDEALKAAAEAAEAELAEAEKPAVTKAKGKKLRVLVDHEDHKPNDVIVLPADEAEAAEAAGWADSNPDAVAYAESIAKES